MEYDVRSWGFEPVRQTYSYKCCQCLSSYTRCCYPLGQILHRKVDTYWTTSFLGTCGVCTLSQITKHLSIFPFLTQPSRYANGFSSISSTTPAWSDFPLVLAYQNSCQLSSSASPCISYNFSWYTLISCKNSKQSCQKALDPFWVMYSLISPSDP